MTHNTYKAALSILSNDEVSTDDELRVHFRDAFKCDGEEIEALIEMRGILLKQPKEKLQ